MVPGRSATLAAIRAKGVGRTVGFTAPYAATEKIDCDLSVCTMLRLKRSPGIYKLHTQA